MRSSSDTARKLKRVASKPKPIIMFDSPCISGGLLKSAEIIPVQRCQGGVQFVQVKTNSKWLHALLTGYQSSNTARAILSKAIADIRTSLKITELEGDEGAGRDASDGGAVVVAEAMRAKMLEAGMSDSDQSVEDDDADGSNYEIEEKQTPKKKGKKQALLHTSEVRVHEISLEVAKHQKKLVLIYTQKNVEDFLKLCSQYDQTEVLGHQEDKKQKRRQQCQELYYVRC